MSATAPAWRPLTPPLAPFDRPVVRLALTSAVVLFAELVFIRWVQEYIFYVAFFTNFLLMASFLGIGVGILMGDRLARLPASPFAAFLYVLVAVVYVAQPRAGQSTGEELLFGKDLRPLVDLFVVIAAVVLTTGAMASIAAPLGPLLRSMPPLRAYAIDISGSLAGIAAFLGLAALSTPPVVWFAVIAVALGLLRLGTGVTAWSLASGVLLASVVGLAYEDSRRGEIWSAYNRIGVQSGYLGTVRVFDEPRRYDAPFDALEVGGILTQSLWRTAGTSNSYYDDVYRLFPGRTFERALVIGAGGGTDTAFALAAGTRRVDAVEIDPEIIRIGQARHPDRPYSDPRTRLIVDDGRAFLRRTDERYDLVVLGQLGSQVTAAAAANLRLDSFVFTEEAFASIREHLTPDGVLVVYYIKATFSTERIARLLETTFDEPALVKTYRHEFGEGAVLLGGPGTAPLRADPATHGLTALRLAPDTLTATDDWPFAVVRSREIQPQYLAALGGMLLFAGTLVSGALAVTGRRARTLSPHFFVLGTAFLLLETRSLVTFGLLFGTTWIVNAFVFFAILTSVLIATAISAAVRIPRAWLYAGLGLAVLAGYLVPPATLLVDPPGLRYVAASILAFAPVLFANLVFTYSFRDTRRADIAFASNLVGAMLGGIIEWTALITGYRVQLLVVGALYVAAYVLATRWRIAGDRELERPV